MIRLAAMTSIANSVVLLIGLKFLQVFHFINWNPIAFLDSIYYIRLFGVPEKWLVLGLLIAIFSTLLFWLTTLMITLPNTITSIIYGVVVVFIIYSWMFSFQYEWKLWKNISIPFIVLVFISARFIVETSVFYTKEKLFSYTK